eukprot:TRINITY_DN32777_c0_g1_i1.p1 TRINITY_DN32777_c0_g1~~TRINITY_DN32777_c0_g1_i1.p1  ORF type:complete len:190 (+),score=19.34 TRINITY_DN32777_c0_g1_i1:49-618(+)
MHMSAIPVLFSGHAGRLRANLIGRRHRRCVSLTCLATATLAILSVTNFVSFGHEEAFVGTHQRNALQLSTRNARSKFTQHARALPSLLSSIEPKQDHVQHYRGNHKILDINNAVVVGDVEDVRAKATELVEAMAQAARDEGPTVIMTHIEVFDGSVSPPGFASVVLLDESHLSAHSYSDTGLLAIDAFT